MSSLLSHLDIGDSLSFQLVKSNFIYEVKNKYKNVVLIAGGTGITAILQVWNADMVENKEGEEEKVLRMKE
jgi:ferredoxin-NADP reductase